VDTPFKLSVPFMAIVSGLLAGCAGSPAPVAYENHVFYEHDASGDGNLNDLLERPFDALDDTSNPELEHEGVEILGGVARFSRPKDWIIRSGSIRPEGRFIEYVSPRQVVFSVYERLESPREPWHVVLERYEAETKDQGGQLLGKSVPLSSYDSQARAYDVKRAVPAGKIPFISYSREYVVRSHHRIVLVQMVRPTDGYGASEAELLQVVKSLRVL
jgi:hypothetical protein